ncbi:poly-gamma-glutamate capsule biosynthesis protein CapA/YwtB (metallophosphatase superfamily) [Parabacteroides sp. PF5-13]|uniref:CapA family protein n=1 Tax=Parabacteroides sp. PF5-13 TaxID=2940638 RepID=UPI0024743100|nr:CapA family protein [Parabacteroides sp. PF5-13]MDH6315899.1 poly-gamma-glutamate capsule biosynthesis protein CapA/YwtB (metallophosphatase superfamily) [Parabacteroides sp. PF5-13]
MKPSRYISAFLAAILLSSSCRQEAHLTICFTGDVLLDRGVREQIEKKGIDYLFADVAPLFRSSDAVVVNLECPLTDTVSPINKKYIFRADPAWLPALRNSGITHTALANNHSMDQGRNGLKDTYYHLSESGITALGYGENQATACEPVIIAKDGIRVAVFNSVLVPLENWVYLEDEPGVCQATAKSLAAEIEQYKAVRPTDYIVVFLHWGLEYQPEPTLLQRRDAACLIDAGADAVIGHHPHVIQPESSYKEKPVFYSLGNFVFDQNRPGTNEALLVRLAFHRDTMTYSTYKADIINGKPILKK